MDGQKKNPHLCLLVLMQDICVDKEDHVCKNTKHAPIHFGKVCTLHVIECVCKHLAMKDRHACTLA